MIWLRKQTIRQRLLSSYDSFYPLTMLVSDDGVEEDEDDEGKMRWGKRNEIEHDWKGQVITI